MVSISITVFNHTLEKSHAWLKALKEVGDFCSEEEAYTALRAVLHSLRDRLTIEGAAHLAAQLPMLIRGMYYEGWKPSSVPHKERTKKDFIDGVRSNLQNAANIMDPEEATKKVFQFLCEKISAGEVNNIISQLPENIADLWV